MTVQLSRRDLILAAVGAAIASAGSVGFPATLFAQSAVTPEQFLALSEKLTQTPKLDLGVATTILGGFLATGHGDEIAQLLGENFNSFTPLANAIVAAWYSGLYTTVPRGSGASAHPLRGRVQRVATFDQALVWNALTFTKPWGECGGETGYWAQSPEGLRASMADDITADVIIVGSGISGALMASKLAAARGQGRDPRGGRRRSIAARPSRHYWNAVDQGAGVPLSADAAGDAPDLERPRLLVQADRPGQVREHLHQGGRRHDLALARHLPPLRAERLPAEVALRPGRRLADLLRRDRAVLRRRPRTRSASPATRRDDLGAPRTNAYPMAEIPQTYPRQGLLQGARTGPIYEVRSTPQGRNSRRIATTGRPAAAMRAASRSARSRRSTTRPSMSTGQSRPARTLHEQTNGGLRRGRRGPQGHRHPLQALGRQRGQGDGQGLRPRRARDRDAAAAAQLEERGDAERGRQLLRPGRPQPDGPPDAALLGARERPGLSLSRAALDLGDREPARRRFPQGARRVPHRDRQRRLVVADRRADLDRAGARQAGSARQRRSTRRWPYQAARHIRLASLVEQPPDPENRVTLDTTSVDVYGVAGAEDRLPARRLHQGRLCRLGEGA